VQVPRHHRRQVARYFDSQVTPDPQQFDEAVESCWLDDPKFDGGKHGYGAIGHSHFPEEALIPDSSQFPRPFAEWPRSACSVIPPAMRRSTSISRSVNVSQRRETSPLRRRSNASRKLEVKAGWNQFAPAATALIAASNSSKAMSLETKPWAPRRAASSNNPGSSKVVSTNRPVAEFGVSRRREPLGRSFAACGRRVALRRRAFRSRSARTCLPSRFRHDDYVLRDLEQPSKTLTAGVARRRKKDTNHAVALSGQGSSARTSKPPAGSGVALSVPPRSSSRRRMLLKPKPSETLPVPHPSSRAARTTRSSCRSISIQRLRASPWRIALVTISLHGSQQHAAQPRIRKVQVLRAIDMQAWVAQGHRPAASSRRGSLRRSLRFGG